MIWHQMLVNGQQNTLLSLVVILLFLALIGVAVTTIATVTRAVVTTAMRLVATSTIRSDPHFICSPEHC